MNIPCLNEDEIKTLIGCAEATALRYCSPVYLVGSSLNSKYPNDIDIYVAVNSDTYLRLFTNYSKASESKTDHISNINDMKLQQARIYKKNKEYFEKYIKAWDFDIKFQNIESFLKHDGKRIRLDVCYLNMW